MADLPEVGLNAVIQNLSKFVKGAAAVRQAYDEINAGADTVEDTTSAAIGVISGLGGAASAVASGGLTLLVGAIAAVAAAAGGAVVGLGAMAKASFDLASDIESSQKNIQAQLGLTEEDAEKLGETATQVWANNFAGSVGEATEALIEVRKQLKGISDEELQDATENAIRLSDAFGIDIRESTNAANVLMKQFGISQQEAFDFITVGFQRGLNSSDDFIDSISEYGGLFGQGGGSADEFFSLLETGLQGGVLGTDKAADAFKEFSIRVVDLSDSTIDAFHKMGVNYDEFLKNIAIGDATVPEAMQSVLFHLSKIEDPIARNIAGVQLFGTQWEDIGEEAMLAINLTATSLDDLAGATDTLNAQYETLPQVFEGVKRQLLLAIKPIGDAILNAANEVMPLLFDAIEDLKPALNDFADILSESVTAGVQELIPWVKETLVPALQEFGDWLVSTGLPALKKFAKFVWNDVIPAIIEFAKWIGEELIPFLQDLWKLFKGSKKQGKTVVKTFESILKIIEPLIKKGFKNLLEIWEIIKKWTDKNWPLIQKTIEVVMKAIRKVIGDTTKDIQKFWEKWGDEIMAITEFIFDTIFKVVKTGLENVLSIITVVMKIITGDWEGAWEEILKIVDRTLDTVQSIVKKGFDILKSVIAQAMEIIMNKIEDAWNDIKRDTESALNNLKNKISDIWNKIKSSVEGIVSNMIEGIKNKINASVESIKSALTNMFTNAINAVANAIANLSALATMVTNLVNAIKNKISAAWQTIRTGISDAISKAATFFSVVGSLLTKLGTIASKIATAIKQKIADTWQDIKTGITDSISTAIDKITSLSTIIIWKLKKIGQKIIQGVIDGIEDAKSELRDILEGVADLIPQWLADWLGIGSPAKIMIPIGESLIEGLQAGIMSQVPALLNQMQNQVAAPMVAAPALGAGTTTNVTNVFNTGGNTIANDMDAAVFEQRVLNVIRNNL